MAEGCWVGDSTGSVLSLVGELGPSKTSLQEAEFSSGKWTYGAGQLPSPEQWSAPRPRRVGGIVRCGLEGNAMAGTRAPTEGATSLDRGHSQAVFEYTRDIKRAFLVTIGLLAQWLLASILRPQQSHWVITGLRGSEPWDQFSLRSHSPGCHSVGWQMGRGWFTLDSVLYTSPLWFCQSLTLLF